jgi:threonine dehydrogenase-like Zn-dependent dehydrogenase
MTVRKAFAMVLVEPRKLEPRELPLPEIDDDYEQYEGVLGTPTPVVPGHEPIGVIERIGDRAARRWGVDVGDRVAVETLLSCRYCPPCAARDYQLCERRRVYSYIPLTVNPGLWGAYAEYLYLAPGSFVHKINRSVPPSIAALFNPLGAGFRWGVEIPRLRSGDSVAILGPGQRGLACVLACRAAGAGKVLVTGLGRDRSKLELARRFGADVTVDVESEDAREHVREMTSGRGVDVVVEVTSYASAPVAAALDYVRPGGTVVLAGVKGFKPIPDFVSDKIVVNEITVRGAFGVTSAGYRNAIRLIESRSTEVAAMHTHDFDLLDAEHAIAVLAGRVPGEESIHSCLLPGGFRK